MRFKILDRGEELRPDDLCMFIYVSKQGNVKYKCGKYATSTVAERAGDESYIVLRDGSIPEWQGYGLVVAVRPVKEFEDVPLVGEEGEVLRE